jgi:hypothetical protein
MGRDSQTEYEKNRQRNIKRNQSILQVRKAAGPLRMRLCPLQLSFIPLTLLQHSHADHRFIAWPSTCLVRALAYARRSLKKAPKKLAQK